MQVQELAITQLTQADAVFALIEKMMTTPEADVSKLQVLQEIYYKEQDRQAEREFNEALMRVKQNMPVIKKNRSIGYDVDKNDKSKGQKEIAKYATLEEIDKHVAPLLKENNMSVSYDTETREGGGAVVIGTLRHIKGHSRRASIPLPLDASGGKNNVQGMGSTFSYGRRYTLCMLLDIVVIGDDDDGAGGEITNEQAVELDHLLIESGMDKAKFLKLADSDSVQNIKLKNYGRAINAVKARIFNNEREAKKKGQSNA
jgi:ERF superfamily